MKIKRSNLLVFAVGLIGSAFIITAGKCGYVASKLSIFCVQYALVLFGFWFCSEE
jgi:hypothetical protein